MKYLITGNTGFKGSWLTLLLKNLGHDVYGIALKPEKKSLYEIAKLKNLLNFQYFIDIRNFQSLNKLVKKIEPDFLIHLAAQPLVKKSYLMPRDTIEINVNGTYNILDLANQIESLKACLVITTDKVYENRENYVLYNEFDNLGGFDPYSASKAMADLLTQSWAKSFSSKKYLIARAGNVIGGGDFSGDRLIPDFYKSFSTNTPLIIRNPQSIRPWQHVLDCLNGYIKLINKFENLANGSSWNFGPNNNEHKTVSDVLNELNKNLLQPVEIKIINSSIYHEANTLMLNSEKSRSLLNWKEKLNFDNSIKWTLDWYKSFKNGQDPLSVTQNQIKSYLNLNY